MLDGIFSEAQRLAREAIKVARACDPPAREPGVHATTTLAVALAWGSDPNAAIELLREAETAAREVDDPDALFRVPGQPDDGPRPRRPPGRGGRRRVRGDRGRPRAGLEAVYGNFLAGNVADIAVPARAAGRRRGALSARALSWLAVGVAFLMGIVQLATVEIETEAGERAGRLLGQTVLEFDAVREPQLAAPYYLAAASFALWRGDVADAGRSVERGWAVVRTTEEWVLAARMTAMVARVDAAAAAEARERRQLAPLAAARSRTAEVLAVATKLVEAAGAPSSAGSRRVAEAYLATARAYQRRLEGDDDAAVWAKVATMWRDARGPLRRGARPLAPGRGAAHERRRALGPGGGSPAAAGGGPPGGRAGRAAAGPRSRGAVRPRADRPAGRGGGDAARRGRGRRRGAASSWRSARS